MKQLKRWLSVCVVTVLLLAMCPLLSVSASSCTVSLQTKSARQGDEVTLTVSISEVSNLDAVELHLYFDPAALTFVRAETAGFLKSNMDMSDVTLWVGTKNHICITGMALQPTSGSGDMAYITFRVGDDVPDGLAAVTFDVAASNVLLSSKPSPFDAVDGGVMVDRNGITGETVPTATPSTNGITAGTTVVTDQNGNHVTLPAVTVVDNIDGTAVTNPNGQPRYEYQIPITVDSASADPGQEVAVYVSVLSATDVTMAAINVQFDTSALTFVKGEPLGNSKDALKIAHETFDNAFVKLSYYGDGITLNGNIARLVFRVKNSAKKGDYRLSLTTSELQKDHTVVLPVDYNSGTIHVNKDGIGIFGSVWTYVIAVAVIAAGAAAIVLVKKYRKKHPAKQKTEHAPITDVDDEGF